MPAGGLFHRHTPTSLFGQESVQCLFPGRQPSEESRKDSLSAPVTPLFLDTHDSLVINTRVVNHKSVTCVTWHWAVSLRLSECKVCVYLMQHKMLKGFSGGSDGKESACSAGDPGSILGWGRSHGGGHGNPLQYSCLGTPRRTEEPEGLQSIGSQRVGHD